MNAMGLEPAAGVMSLEAPTGVRLTSAPRDDGQRGEETTEVRLKSVPRDERPPND